MKPIIEDLTIEIPVETYNNLLIAANELEQIKNLLRLNRARYCGLDHRELDVLCKLFSIEAEEEE